MKKLLSCVVALAMVVSLCIPSTTVYAVAATSNVEGSGTQADPYVINSEADFSVLDQREDYIYAELGANITLTNDGTTIKNFKGELDGNSFTITNEKSGTFIKNFISGKLSNYTWNLSTFQYMVEDQTYGNEHVYDNIIATGDVTLTSNNNNESPLLVYATGDTTMKNVTIDMNINSPTYNGLLIGYEPYHNSKYVFENCTIKGTYIGSDVGILFGNGSYSGEYGIHNIIGANGTEKNVELTVSGLDFTKASVIGLKTKPHILCGVSYNAEMDVLENQLAADAIGYENLTQAAALEGYTFSQNSDGKVKINVNNVNEQIDHFVVVSEIYSNMFINGQLNGTMKHSVSERIDVVDGVQTYYSTLGKVKFYDGINGEFGTTGINGEIKTITVDGVTYYTLMDDKDDQLYTFSKENKHSESAKDAQMVKVLVYDENNNLLNIVNGPQVESFDTPEISTVKAMTGTTLSDVKLDDGWVWVSPQTEVVYGGQIAFAQKDSQVVPVEIIGESVPISGIELDKNEISIKVGESSTVIATVKPEDAYDKTVTWESENTEIATVEDGVITGVNPGMTTVTAVAGEYSEKCNVVVNEITSEQPPEVPLNPEIITPGMSEEAAQQASETVTAVIEKILDEDVISVNGVDSTTIVAIKGAVAAGSTITTSIQADAIDEPENQEVVAKIEQAITNIENRYDAELIIGQYIDLGILIKINGENAGNITELDAPIEFTIAIPDEIKDVAKTYFIIRTHINDNNEIETSIIQPTLNDNGTLTFTTDRFSTYALAYSTAELAEAPSGDNGWIDSEDILGDITGDDNQDQDNSSKPATGDQSQTTGDKTDADKVTSEESDSDSPKTGDDTMVLGYVIMMLAALGIGGTLVVNRKKN